MIKDPSVLSCKDRKKWVAWLDKNSQSSAGVWLKIAKKNSGAVSVSYAEAVESALCYGWIDSQGKSLDDTAYLQRFSPRGPRSIWSEVNKKKALELMARGMMKPSGLKAVEQAKQNGRWEKAYQPQSRMEVPPDFQAALDSNRKAGSAFDKLNSANRYAMLFRLHNVKRPETRRKRIELYLGMLERGETYHGEAMRPREYTGQEGN